MRTWVQCVTGDFDGKAMRWYLMTVSAIYWGLIFSCIWNFPNHGFSIMSDTYSALGSWDERNNPQWWWLFSAAMIFWGPAMFPVLFYNYRRLAVISATGAALGSILLGIGGVGVTLIGVFPDAHGFVFGNHEIRQIHKYVSLTGAGFYMLSNICYGLLLISGALRNAGKDLNPSFSYRRFLPPYLVWMGIFGVGVYHLLAWESVYKQLKAAAIAAGQPVPGHFGGALNTRYSFPLWENLTIYSLFFFVVWFALALPAQVPSKIQQGRATPKR